MFAATLLLAAFTSATVAQHPSDAAGDLDAQRRIALARARTELVAQSLNLPLARGATVRQWAARTPPLDRDLRGWLRARPPLGRPRAYSSGVLEIDVRVGADELGLKLIELSNQHTVAGAERLTPAGVADAVSRWPHVWATGAAGANEELGANCPSGWEDVSPEGWRLARAAAAADAFHGLLERARALRISPAVHVREFLQTDPRVDAAVREQIERLARLDASLTEDQLALAEATISLADLVRGLTAACEQAYAGERFRPEDFREMLLIGESDDLRAAGEAIPPERCRTLCPDDVVTIDAPAWADKSLTAAAAASMEALPAWQARAFARGAALDSLREQIGRLALPDGRAVQEALAAAPLKAANVELLLRGVRVQREREVWPQVDVELELPLRRLWLILSGPPGE